MEHPWKPALVLGTVLGILLLPRGGGAADPGLGAPAKQEKVTAKSPMDRFGLGKQEIGLAVGYGFGIRTKDTKGELDDVRYIYLAPRWGIGISDPMGGAAWYRGNFELLGEGAVLFNREPKNGFAGGITALVRYNFLPGGKFIPFVEGGAGILDLDFDLEGRSDGFNFSPQAGLGFHYFVSQRTAFTGEWRWHHISNADIEKPNRGINSSLFLIGISVFLH